MAAMSNNSVPIMPGPTARYAQWPPKIADVKTLGYIVDSNGRSYPRDIGRSSVMGGSGVIFQFGDTFAHDDDGNFVGGTSSTAAVVPNPGQSPTVTSYALGENGKVPSFIPMLPEEKDENNKRNTLWCFGGIIEVGKKDGGVAAGWAFYQKGTHHQGPTDEHVFEYTGVAKVYSDVEKKKVCVYRPRTPLVLFQKYEPSFGTFSAALHDDIAYLFGHSFDCTKVMLARVHVRWVLERSRYTYWDGKRYQADLSRAKAVMEDVQHGAIYRSKLFESKKGRDWVFVGCSRFGDNKVLLGVSANPEGPYTTVELMSAFPLISMPEGSFRYCMYPHPWAFDEEKGELMITWSEGSMLGGVIAVKVEFAMSMDMGRPTSSMVAKDKSRKGICHVS